MAGGKGLVSVEGNAEFIHKYLRRVSVDQRKRSFLKAITWRILGIIVLGALVWFFTGNLEQTSAITIIFNSIRLILYYFHERFWDRIKWGKVKTVD